MSDEFELFDKGNELENRWFGSLSSALQAARSNQWRTRPWMIFSPTGEIIRQYNSGEEMEYWRTMKIRGSANIGPIPNI